METLPAGHAALTSSSPISTISPTLTTAGGHEHDFAWLVGRWTVRHRRLKERLAGCAEWEEFAGMSTQWLTLGGLGMVEDNVLELPGATYRAMAIRAFDPETEEWLIWWHDGRAPSKVDPPVRGRFDGGVGTFLADDTLNGKPIKVRFRWRPLSPTSAHWEQAFSPDGGATWEVNWEMQFTRAQ